MVGDEVRMGLEEVTRPSLFISVDPRGLLHLGALDEGS